MKQKFKEDTQGLISNLVENLCGLISNLREILYGLIIYMGGASAKGADYPSCVSKADGVGTTPGSVPDTRSSLCVGTSAGISITCCSPLGLGPQARLILGKSA